MQQGAQWFALLRSGEASEAERRQWQAWRGADPAHEQAWQYVEAVSQGFAPAQAGVSREQAGQTLLQADRQLRGRRRWTLGITAVAACAVTGWSAWRSPGLRGQVLALAADHRTAIGEIRAIELPDRSRIWLNTASALDVDFGPAARRLVLLRGEVLVQTASDTAGRPFLLDSRDGRMQALGTQFSVRQDADRTLLSVFQSAVQVRPRDAAAPQLVRAGTALAFDAHGLLQPGPLDGGPPTWPNRMLAAHDLTLRALADELNRYTRGHISVADEVAGLRVVGSFPLDNLAAVMKALEADQPVRVVRPLPGWIRIEAWRR